jgi:hypothetical protein
MPKPGGGGGGPGGGGGATGGNKAPTAVYLSNSVLVEDTTGAQINLDSFGPE